MNIREAYVICKREKSKIRVYEVKIDEYYNEKGKSEEAFFLKYVGTCQDFYRYAVENLGSISYIAPALIIVKKCLEDVNMRKTNRLWNSIHDVFQRVYNIISIYESIERYDEYKYGLEIKIPKIDNITELKKFIDGLEFVFTKCPFFQHNEESLKFQYVENGSILLIFGVVGVVGATVAVGSVLLNNIAAFMDKCFVIKSHKYTCEMQKLQIENAEMEQKEKVELLKSINELYKIALKNVIKELEAGTGYQIKDGDERGRVEQSFDRMIKMLDQGLQIHSAINSSEEVKALFAPLEMHYLSIKSGLERIEEKDDTAENSKTE